MSRANIANRIVEAGAVAVIRLNGGERVLQVAEALLEGGVTVMEITLTTPGALHHIENLSRQFGQSILIGAGSVLGREATLRAVNAGARFVVSPVVDPRVVEAAHESGVPAIPGAFTPTEAQTANAFGADIVKLFPAHCLGKNFIPALLAPLPHLRLMPTGGVRPETAGDWICAGAAAVGIGGALVGRDAVAEGRLDVIADRARIACRSIAVARA